MLTSAEAFFEQIRGRSRSTLPARLRGTLRVDLVGLATSHWLVDLDADRLVVSRVPEPVPADAVLMTSPQVFAQLVRGETPIIAALLRNDAAGTGDTRLIFALRRMFP
ncbi:SCP2 sterol-binding domain-containing protein [Micromonospora marina]|uniref:SCP2 sterol-binding domain-containing protein n=1 Tax=Micromonospora marina TaxID=307120 RepID=UPI00345175BC